MLLSTRRRAIVVALLMFTAVVGLRIVTAHQWNYGPAEAEHFSDQIFGFEVDQGTPPFFLMWARGDGQAFMSIAGDLDGQDNSRGLGNQSYRMSRIGLSIAARILSGGQIELLPFGLAAAALSSYAGLLAVSVRLWDELGARALLLGASPAAIIATVFDTAEGMGSLLLVVAVVSTSGVIAVTSAVMLGITRPSYGTAILASRSGIRVPAALLLSGVVLQVLLSLAFRIGFTGSGGNILLPLGGYLDALPTMRPSVLASAAAVLLMSSVLMTMAFKSSHSASFRAAAGVSALLALSVGPSTFVGPLSPLRVSGALVVLLVLEPLFVSTHSTNEHSSANTALDSNRTRDPLAAPMRESL